MRHTPNAPKVADAAELDPLVQELIRLRKAFGFTQQETAGLAGVSRRTLNAIERGASDFSINTLRRLCTALGVDLAFKTQSRPTLDDVVAENRRISCDQEIYVKRPRQRY